MQWSLRVLAHTSLIVTNKPPAVQTVDTNRDLLAQYCSATGMAVKNTFLHKSTHQQITFYDRRCHTPMGAFDPRWHRQLDLLLCSSDYLQMVHDIVSRPDIRVGPTTHHLQIAKLHIPIRKTEAQPKKQHGKIPWDLWQDREVKSQIERQLQVALSKAGGRPVEYASDTDLDCDASSFRLS